MLCMLCTYIYIYINNYMYIYIYIYIYIEREREIDIMLRNSSFTFSINHIPNSSMMRPNSSIPRLHYVPQLLLRAIVFHSARRDHD